MDFIDLMKNLSDRIEKSQDKIMTEEATKNALIMPFIQALGYDIFDPHEVIPEFTADVGIKKGEKVDYAIIKDGNPIILMECKWCGEKLDNHASQLYRYFGVTKAKFGILTNGIIYKVFTDLDELNKMDTKPFLEINMLDIRENLIFELKRFCKSTFDADEITSVASELKYSKEIKNILNTEMNTPSENFVKHFASQIYPGRITQNILDRFTELTKKSFNQFLSDLINERLKSAIIPEAQPTEQITEEPDNDKKNEIITTLEELEGLAIVKAILKDTIDPGRVTYKDTVKYFNITLDNNIRKIICRLYLNGKQKQIAFIEDKSENKMPIENINGIFTHADMIIHYTSKIEEEYCKK